jgi:hypothetical protein
MNTNLYQVGIAPKAAKDDTAVRTIFVSATGLAEAETATLKRAEEIGLKGYRVLGVNLIALGVESQALPLFVVG